MVAGEAGEYWRDFQLGHNNQKQQYERTRIMNMDVKKIEQVLKLEPVKDFLEAFSGLRSLATELKYIGIGNAVPSMGAIEFHATKVEEVASAIADGFGGIGAHLQDHSNAMEAVASAIEKLADAVSGVALITRE